MEQNQQNTPREPNPRRRKRDPKRVFIETYFPVIIAAAAILLVIVLICVSCAANKQKRDDFLKESLAAKQEEESKAAQRRAEAEACMAKAKAYADVYDFQAAIDELNSFGNDIFDYDDMLVMRDEYKYTMENMVEYTPEQVIHLSVQVLIADAPRAFADTNYGNGYKRNFITTQEFTNMLTELYNNGYVLVSMEDLVTTVSGEGFTTYTAKNVTLPQGKKPFMLTETQVNYYSYMVDPDGDGQADKNGAGFASRLILENGELTNEMVDAQGNTITGSFDVVPLFEDFLKTHPDFSYHGARPILALTGYNGILGYRNDGLTDAVPVLDALRQKGYTIAFYTYSNADYEASTLSELRTDVKHWQERIEPVVGKTELLVYARNADIAAPGPYTGEKFTALHDNGFRFFFGFCTDGKPWFVAESSYIRQGRIIVSADNLANHADWFAGIFNPTAVLVESR